MELILGLRTTTHFDQFNVHLKKKEVHSSVCCCLSVLCVLMWFVLELSLKENPSFMSDNWRTITSARRSQFFFSKTTVVLFESSCPVWYQVLNICFASQQCDVYNCLLSESVLLWNAYICLYSVDSRRLWDTGCFDSCKVIPAWHPIQRSPALIRNRTTIPFVLCMLCQNKALLMNSKLQVYWALRTEEKIQKSKSHIKIVTGCR